jgi:hypothetical protein
MSIVPPPIPTIVFGTPYQRVRSSSPSFSGELNVNDYHYHLTSGVKETAVSYTTDPPNINVNITVTGSNSEYIIHNSNNKEISVGSGYLSWIPIYADIKVEKYGYQMASPYIEFIANNEAINVFKNYKSGTLGQHILDQSNTLLGIDQDMYGSYGIRNQNVWTEDIDLTGIAFWNSRANNVHRGGTLVSPRHILTVSHYRLLTGDKVRWIKQDNTVVERTIVSTSYILEWDRGVCLLDSDVPNDIKFYKVLPANWRNYLSIRSDAYLPTIHANKSRKIFHRHRTLPWQPNVAILAHTLAPDKSQNVISGDSGQPFFHIINGELVLLALNTSPSSGSNISDLISEYNAMMTSLGGGYTLTTIDLSGFNYYGS